MRAQTEEDPLVECYWAWAKVFYRPAHNVVDAVNNVGQHVWHAWKGVGHEIIININNAAWSRWPNAGVDTARGRCNYWGRLVGRPLNG